MIELQAKISKQAYRNVTMRLIYRSPFGITLTIIGGLLLIACCIDALLGEFQSTDIYSGICWALLLILYPPIFAIIRADRNYNSSKTLKEEINWQIDEQEYRVHTESVKSEYKWTSIHKMKVTKEWILIYYSWRVTSFIPKAAFKSEADLNLLFDYARKNNVRVD